MRLVHKTLLLLLLSVLSATAMAERATGLADVDVDGGTLKIVRYPDEHGGFLCIPTVPVDD